MRCGRPTLFRMLQRESFQKFHFSLAAVRFHSLRGTDTFNESPSQSYQIVTMLFRFATPRTRDWKKYITKLETLFDYTLAEDDSLSHLTLFLRKAHEKRQILTKLLDESAKDACRPDDIIATLHEYLPALQPFMEAIEANNIALTDHLDIVWTSFLMNNVNAKSLSNSLKWERISCYTLLGLAHYQKAIETHQFNRQIAHKTKIQIKKQNDADSDDPFFAETVDPNTQKPQIHDDKERMKEISHHLKQAASIWSYTATLFPVLIVAKGKKAFDVIPESFGSVIAALSQVAAINAQEFMVQLSVQTNKSPSLTAKLSMGVSDKLRECDKMLTAQLSKNAYYSIKQDFVLYLKLRSDLYEAIAFKYNANVLRQNGKYGEGVACYQRAINVLKSAMKGYSDKKKKDPASVETIKKSMNKQLEIVNALFNEAKKENESVYFEVVPDADLIEEPESKFVVKVGAFKPLD